jgi:putative membrane protein
MEFSQFNNTRKGIRDYLWVAARGFAMGAADVVPGVSGGTMAFILGIYEELIHAIHSVDLAFFRRLFSLRLREAFASVPWQFVLALGIGILAAIMTLASALSHALHTYPVLVWAFFFGLVLASVVVVRKRVSRWTPAVLMVAALAAVGSYFLVGMVPVETPEEPWFLFLSGALAITAMILPGISGAFILVLLGKYHYVLNAVVTGDVLTLLIVVAGAVVGLVTFARILRWLFKNHHDITVAALTGLILGALRKVWPWKDTSGVQELNIFPPAFDAEFFSAVLLMLFGFALVVLLDYLALKEAASRDVVPREILAQAPASNQPDRHGEDSTLP